MSLAVGRLVVSEDTFLYYRVRQLRGGQLVAQVDRMLSFPVGNP